LILYGLAYAALWPGLTRPVVTLQGNPTFWSNSKFGIGEGGKFMEATSRSTVELVVELFNSRYYFPCGVIALFSIVSPCVKLLVILYGEIVGNIFRIKFEESSKIVDLRKGLRYIAKYQCVDVFVTIITRQLVNSDLVLCRVDEGFYYFSFYALLSILAAQVSDTVPLDRPVSFPSHRVSKSQSDRISKLDAFLLFSSVLMYVVGQAWALGFPILAVKFLFQSKIVIGEKISSLLSFFEILLRNTPITISDYFCTILVAVTCVIVPTIVVVMSTLIQCCDPSRSSRVFFTITRVTSFLADWALLDVFAVALLTSLFAFASFSVLRTAAPWGFYCVLMAAMSAYEVGKAVQVSLTDNPGNYVKLPEDGEGVELQDLGDEKKGSDLDSPENQRTPTPSKKPTYIVKSGIIHVIITIIKRLGIPFFMLKALGWAIFFIVWYMNTQAGSLDIKTLSATLKTNVPLVSRALQSSLPSAIGMCDHFGHPGCLEKGYLHYEKNSAYEVLARRISGFQKVEISDMFVSVPGKKKLSLNVKGSFLEVNLSLFIGQCFGQWFGGDSDPTQIPQCSSVFDEIHSWNNVKWSLEVEADCNENRPYVRNIVVDEVILESEMKIAQEIGFGISLPIDDLSEQFKKGIKDSIQPLLAKEEPWIPWGPANYDLTSLLSKLVELNTDAFGGNFQCPGS
jgi:uncharacterized paraquat-inducible protein A